MRIRSKWGLWVSALVALMLAACQPKSDSWFDEGYARFEPLNPPAGGHATELELAWLVTPAEIPTAVAMLEHRPAVPLSKEDGTRLTGKDLSVPDGKSLFLIRAIALDGKSIPLRVWLSGTQIHTEAGLYATCFFIRPGLRRQPMVVALGSLPQRVTVSYSCDG